MKYTEEELNHCPVLKSFFEAMADLMAKWTVDKMARPLFDEIEMYGEEYEEVIRGIK